MPQPKEPQAHNLLKDIAHGELDTELSKQIGDMVELLRKHVMQRDKGSVSKGSLTLKLNFAAECHGGGEVTMDVDYDITKKEPKPVRSKDLFFVKGRELVYESPRQSSLDFEAELNRQ